MQLQRLIPFCCSRETQQLTPSDLTYKKLSIETLDQLQKSNNHNIEDIYPLSPMQEGMLFHCLYENDRSAYFEQLSYHLEGEFDASYVEKSVNFTEGYGCRQSWRAHSKLRF